jgi:hypothetical protein
VALREQSFRASCARSARSRGFICVVRRISGPGCAVTCYRFLYRSCRPELRFVSARGQSITTFGWSLSRRSIRSGANSSSPQQSPSSVTAMPVWCAARLASTCSTTSRPAATSRARSHSAAGRCSEPKARAGTTTNSDEPPKAKCRPRGARRSPGIGSRHSSTTARSYRSTICSVSRATPTAVAGPW